MNLNVKGFERAREFILAEGRPLEKALFDLEFGSGSVSEVVTHLGAFQNPDGGFGKGLEADVRTPTSSALCTEIGLRIMAERDIPADHPMVVSAVKYLLESFDQETQVWRVIPEDANDYPHAPWWHDEGGSLARTFDDYSVIPRAGILAYLHHYSELVPNGWLDEVTAATLAEIQSLETGKFGGGGDALVYTQRLAEALNLKSEPIWLTQRIQELAEAVVTKDADQWTGYCAPPLKLAPTPNSISAPTLSDCLPAHLDYLIEHQSPEGYWDVTWSWSDYSEEWENAKREWRGVLTLDVLRSLRAFGRFVDL